MQELLKFSALHRYTKALSVALHERDPYTRFHCERVINLATEVGIACKLADRELVLLGVSASFHDVGKIGIPDSVLRKPGKLDADEWEIMKTHSERGERILRATSLPDAPAVANIIRHHHEHFDGSGYPDALSGDGIPLLARILSMADSYDAMATVRAYHRPRTHEEILAAMRAEVGIKFDPSMFAHFEEVIEKSPSRTK
ncbi:MAG TPA: HD domain-containing phosphohydrolase [Noviherbaspirillum sp.]|uniref:HD-GYP domain-containing protein n=1 Tax=Noviherbaspirillum sp. TaxID=1926288 RepID=UPI002B46EB62|nr:HD domain-containing phosphohydrolase [Noviherbaspirillum sp.]HJV86473.1 HD domain-containing phosphohydrolase [Noviherbaspirillum sp.]